ncbi:Lipocalin-like domain-containing protein [Bradyrhizobium lablabi]|uniref:Lipocalin-like domain-containing protein n=1 Tax=Bradyrhizobium lablabi TaxID=722472 RepID=A0A1M6QAC4_9BRAD|nr:lipocalin-like domain-containing protein [Bradyrhizobium lablabi]SHK17090.1 Lipocalin-like domain-containing protein [Bradyrhizobium lablabi]
MQRIIASFGLIALMLGAADPASALSPEDLVGTWKMLSTVRQVEGSDKVIENLGEHPKGILIITQDHRFMIIETGDGRKAASTTEEFAALQKSELAYSGLVTFSPDPNNSQGLKMTNKVDIAWNEEWTGTDQTRFLSLDGNRLTIPTPLLKNPISGEMATSTLVFERSK